ncbi:GMC oxidoreductase [Sphaerobolus stellatus SS14]|nr:GMC oxidoreductase [Sphaerobolus stellatus SS14]
MKLFAAGILLATGLSCHAKLYENAADLPAKEFDFVVVGGGTAGNVVANRLTEDPTVSVLVLEAGPSNEGVINSIVPFFLENLLGESQFFWNYTIVPQTGLNGRGGPYFRGHMLGGCSSVNAMFYTRGSAEDYDRFAKVTGDAGWSWDNLQSYFRKNEIWTAPTDGHNETGEFNPAVHGFNGINTVSLNGFPSPFDGRVIQATKELPDLFPFILDWNAGKPLGLGWAQSTIKKGKRSSSATSYLAPQFLNRPNMHVLVNARITKLLTVNQGKTTLDFRNVQFTQNGAAGPLLNVIASKEVILSAGVIGSPFILMHSGIGDRSELEPLGIKSLLNLPSVGKNATDQPGLFTTWLVNSTDTLDNLGRNMTLFNEAFQLWNETGGGPFGNPPETHVGWARIPKNATIFQQVPDPSAGPNTPHFEIYTQSGAVGGPSTGNFLSVGLNIVSVASRGSITLTSNNPFDDPLIDPGFLTNPFEMAAFRAGLASIRRFLSAPAWKDYVIGPFGDLANATTDALLEDFIRNNAGSTAHLVGTVAMSAPNAGFGVINPDLRVKGATGIRVVDASVFPFIPSSHIQVPTYVFAERAADLIKSLWKLK